MISISDLYEFAESRRGRDSATAKRLSKKLGWTVRSCEVDHVCTDPHVWRCFLVFDTIDGKRWACEHGDTRAMATNAALLAAKQAIV